MNRNIQKEEKYQLVKRKGGKNHPNNLNFLYLSVCICFTCLSILIGWQHAVVLMYSEFPLLFLPSLTVSPNAVYS